MKSNIFWLQIFLLKIHQSFKKQYAISHLNVDMNEYWIYLWKISMLVTIFCKILVTKKLLLLTSYMKPYLKRLDPSLLWLLMSPQLANELIHRDWCHPRTKGDRLSAKTTRVKIHFKPWPREIITKHCK